MFGIIYSRFIRFMNKDINTPNKCYAINANNNEICDCKIWCKFPPNGGNGELAYIKMSSMNDNLKTMYKLPRRSNCKF